MYRKTLSYEMLKNPFKKNSIANEYQTLVSEINSLESKFQTLTDSEIRLKTNQLRKQYQADPNLTNITPEAFALTREASVRTLGLRHYDVQLIGGLVLNSGKIAEMRTGEGKTLVATLPAYLNAITKKGVHIVTVNDYLASRDQLSMGQVYRFLGLNTGLIQEDMEVKDRQKNYDADITYVTNSELGFDYLRDNMALNINEVVLRPFNYCIVDEVDSVLIDEAQTPLIISNAVQTSIDKYIVGAEVIDYLEVNIHFKVDEKNKNVILTKEGAIQIEEILGINDLYNPNDPWIPYIINALKATTLFFRNVHYIVQNDQIIIVDEFTGRIMPDRRWSDGLHQAVEAKEGVTIRQNNETAASVTYQNFFLLYPKLSGMTGTAKTAEIEFEKIYNLSVVEIPTARPNLRNDLPDLIYKDELSKWTAIAKECGKISTNSQPVLVGTTSVEKSEMLGQLLNEYKLPYQILNAKPENVRRESEIIAQAGNRNSITIATNMAGRGTDIILGGNIKFKVLKQLYTILVSSKNQGKNNTTTTVFPLTSQLKGISHKFISVLTLLLNNSKFRTFSDTDILRILNETNQMRVPTNTYQQALKFLITELSSFEKKNQKIDNTIVKNLGGLYIIGTERNDSRRIDNQLRGRCARQGDPGTSQFFLSLEDRLLRLFGGPKIQEFMKNQFLDDAPIEAELLSKSLDSAQQRLEELTYDSRKNLFEYDEILNKQRKVIYFERRKILESASVQTKLLADGEQIITEIISKLEKNQITFSDVILRLENLFGTNFLLINKFKDNLNNFDILELKIYLFQEFWLVYETKVLELEIRHLGIIRALERTLILIYIDTEWKEHLQKMGLLRDAVGWRSYGQRNPLFEYKDEAYEFFKRRAQITRHLVIYDLIRSSII